MSFIRVYHGTLEKCADSISSRGVILTKSKPNLDFGPGFYTTPEEKFAKKTANNRSCSYNAFREEQEHENPKTVIFEFDEEAASKLRVKRFDKPDIAWARFVLASRCENPDITAKYENNRKCVYDIVIGPTADGAGKLTPLIKALNDGTRLIEDIELSEILPPSNDKGWGKQISFHTPKSLSCIRQINVI